MMRGTAPIRRSKEQYLRHEHSSLEYGHLLITSLLPMKTTSTKKNKSKNLPRQGRGGQQSPALSSNHRDENNDNNNNNNNQNDNNGTVRSRLEVFRYLDLLSSERNLIETTKNIKNINLDDSMTRKIAEKQQRLHLQQQQPLETHKSDYDAQTRRIEVLDYVERHQEESSNGIATIKSKGKSKVQEKVESSSKKKEETKAKSSKSSKTTTQKKKKKAKTKNDEKKKLVDTTSNITAKNNTTTKPKPKTPTKKKNKKTSKNIPEKVQNQYALMETNLQQQNDEQQQTEQQQGDSATSAACTREASSQQQQLQTPVSPTTESLPGSFAIDGPGAANTATTTSSSSSYDADDYNDNDDLEQGNINFDDTTTQQQEYNIEDASLPVALPAELVDDREVIIMATKHESKRDPNWTANNRSWMIIIGLFVFLVAAGTIVGVSFAFGHENKASATETTAASNNDDDDDLSLLDDDPSIFHPNSTVSMAPFPAPDGEQTCLCYIYNHIYDIADVYPPAVVEPLDDQRKDDLEDLVARLSPWLFENVTIVDGNENRHRLKRQLRARQQEGLQEQQYRGPGGGRRNSHRSLLESSEITNKNDGLFITTNVNFEDQQLRSRSEFHEGEDGSPGSPTPPNRLDFSYSLNYCVNDDKRLLNPAKYLMTIHDNFVDWADANMKQELLDNGILTEPGGIFLNRIPTEEQRCDNR